MFLHTIMIFLFSIFLFVAQMFKFGLLIGMPKCWSQVVLVFILQQWIIPLGFKLRFYILPNLFKRLKRNTLVESRFWSCSAHSSSSCFLSSRNWLIVLVTSSLMTQLGTRDTKSSSLVSWFLNSVANEKQMYNGKLYKVYNLWFMIR